MELYKGDIYKMIIQERFNRRMDNFIIYTLLSTLPFIIVFLCTELSELLLGLTMLFLTAIVEIIRG